RCRGLAKFRHRMLMNLPLLEGPNAILFLQSLFLLSSKHTGTATESAIHTVGASLLFSRMWNALKLTLIISFRRYLNPVFLPSARLALLSASPPWPLACLA